MIIQAGRTTLPSHRDTERKTDSNAVTRANGSEHRAVQSVTPASRRRRTRSHAHACSSRARQTIQPPLEPSQTNALSDTSPAQHPHTHSAKAVLTPSPPLTCTAVINSHPVTCTSTHTSAHNTDTESDLISIQHPSPHPLLSPTLDTILGCPPLSTPTIPTHPLDHTTSVQGITPTSKVTSKPSKVPPSSSLAPTKQPRRRRTHTVQISKTNRIPDDEPPPSQTSPANPSRRSPALPTSDTMWMTVVVMLLTAVLLSVWLPLLSRHMASIAPIISAHNRNARQQPEGTATAAMAAAGATTAGRRFHTGWWPAPHTSVHPQQIPEATTMGMKKWFGWPKGRRVGGGRVGGLMRVNAVAAGAKASADVPAVPVPRQWSEGSVVRVLAVVPHGVDSPYKATWGEVMSHISQRLSWTDPTFQLIMFTEEELTETGAQGNAAWEEMRRLAGQGCQILLGGALSGGALSSRLSAASQSGWLPPIRAFLGSPDRPSPPEVLRMTSLMGYTANAPSMLDQVMARLLPWSAPAKAVSAWNTVQELWSRHSSDDLLFVLLVLINQYVTPVKEVAMTTKGSDFNSLKCMIMNCGSQIMNCVNNPTCKGGLDCLQACSFNDQVCQYRCIVSYETPQFADFALCILQKHNCRSLDAKPPMMPDPQPMTSFRGSALTHEMAEAMLLGWMTPNPGIVDSNALLPFSWLVAGGKNPAYDYFPCQHQLFTRGKAQGVIWYEPVFKAITLDGREVWRRRKYRVRRGTKPGTFYFTVLDNGVTSNEFWRIVDCDEQYQWCLFYYSGAAAAAGLSYSGAVLGTHDGAMPTSPEALSRVNDALRASGIEPWELSYVDNTNCVGAPLELAAA